MKKQFAEVYPALALPRELSFFDYALPEGMHCEPGQIVRISFRRRKVFGIVKKMKSQSDVPARAIQPILEVFQAGAFTSEQIALLEWAAKEYHSSVGLALRSAFLSPTKKEQKLSATPAQVKKSGKFSFTFFQYDFPRAHEEYLNALLKKRDRQSILILFPDIQSLEHYAESDAVLPLQALILHGSLSRSEQWQARERIRQGNLLVLGTLSALYEPFTDLQSIVLTDEFEDMYKQTDRQPHIHARNLAIQLAKIHGSGLIFTGRIPSLDALQMLKKYSGSWHRSERWGSQTTTQISSMKNEQREGPGGILTLVSTQAIQECLAKKEKVIIFRNRRGSYHSLNCRECGWRPSCQQCATPLKLQERGLFCPYCNRTQNIPLQCPQCRSVEIKPSGYGIEGNAKALRALFPDAHILTIDKSSAYTKEDLAKADILIGTEKLFRLALPPIKLAVLLSLESELTQSSWNVTETVYQHIRSLQFAQSAIEKLIVQSYDTEQYILEHLSSTAIQSFLKNELKERQRFHFPPSIRLLKLSYQLQVNEIVDKLEASILAVLKKNNTTIIQEILPAQVRVYGDKKLVQILLKLDPECTAEQRAKILQSLPPEWMIDLDPSASTT
ncbi:MAG: hypothetical protein H6760_01765 [Candidatus Nomurabacteria bacterium]|nr:MAG: hypothetical protein H6760_01765 [Candidatus Nomurabacteria bacterium]